MSVPDARGKRAPLVASALCALALACNTPPSSGPQTDEPARSSAVSPGPPPAVPPEPPRAADPAAGATTPPAAAPADPEGDAAAEPAPEARPVTAEEAEFGVTFQPLADAFGFTQYAHVARTRTGLLFEYLPEGQTLEDWTYHGALLLVVVGETWEDGDSVLPRYVEAFSSRTSPLNERGTFTAPEGDIWFLDYEVGSGSSHQHNLAAVWQVLPGTLAIFQAQHRPESFSAFQVGHFKSIAGQLRPAVERSLEPNPAE